MSSRSPLFLVWAITLAAPVAASPDRTEARIYIGGAVAVDVAQALHGAAVKLQDTGCQQILDDFVDHRGQALREKLGATTPAEFLARVPIRDGEIPKGSGRCAVPGAAAFTVDGAVVFVCGRNFRRGSPGSRETVLIHEMLHTLGLRENPPSPAEITRQVRRRCGR